MKVAQLREMLEGLERVYSAAGAKVPAADMRILAETLRASDNVD